MTFSGNMKVQKMALARPKEVGALRHVVLHTSVYVFRVVVEGPTLVGTAHL